MAGEIIHKEINENVTFQYLDGDENSLWSLFLAVGYIKAENVVKQGESTMVRYVGHKPGSDGNVPL